MICTKKNTYGGKKRAPTNPPPRERRGQPRRGKGRVVPPFVPRTLDTSTRACCSYPSVNRISPLTPSMLTLNRPEAIVTSRPFPEPVHRAVVLRARTRTQSHTHSLTHSHPHTDMHRAVVLMPHKHLHGHNLSSWTRPTPSDAAVSPSLFPQYAHSARA